MSKLKEANNKRIKKSPQSRNPETKLNYLTNLAVDEAEKRILNGTATSQLLVTLINLGTQKMKMELEKMKMDLQVSDAKISQMKSQQTDGELYEQALKAFASYKGEEVEDNFDE